MTEAAYSFAVGGVIQIQVARPQAAVVINARIARTWRARLVGLLGRSSLPAGEALMFPRCNSIHTIGMRFAIDAVFIDRAWRVVALRPHLRPGRLVWPVWKAWGVIELSDGTIARAGLKIGDQLLLPTPLEKRA